MRHISFDLFVVLWNRRQDMRTPHLHLSIARWLEARWQNGDKYLLLMVFRSAGKSTLVGLFAAWLLQQDPNLRIMVLAADLTLAKKMVRNVKRIIERHPLTVHLKPHRADQWASYQFTVARNLEQRDPSMIAQGISGNVTGSRADVIICDDVEVPNTCDTIIKRIDLRDRLAEMNYVLVPGGSILYAGTPHSFYSIYADRVHHEIGEDHLFLEGYQRLVLPVLKDGTSIWPERFPDTVLEQMRRYSGPAKFNSQMMLVPTNIEEGRLNPDLLQFYDDELQLHEAQNEVRLTLGQARMVSAACWWDPAFAAKEKQNDSSVVAAVFCDENGNYCLHRIQYLQCDPHDVADEATQQCRQVVAFIRDLHLPSIVIETNGIGRFLPGLLRRELAAAKVACSVLEASSTRAKTTRILEAFDAPLAAHMLYAHRSVQKTPFVREMREWNPSRGNNPDDGLDAVAGALLSEPVRIKRSAPGVPAANWRGTEQHIADSDFQI